MRAGLTIRAAPGGGFRLNALMWFGLAGGPLAWTAQQIVGWGLSEAHCAAGGVRWGIPARAWEIAATAAAFGVCVAAATAAVSVFLATRNDEPDADPPLGRLHMIATASLAVEAVFLCMILLTGISAGVLMGCRQS